MARGDHFWQPKSVRGTSLAGDRNFRYRPTRLTLRYNADATSHSLASAHEQPLEVVRVHTLLISSVHLLYFECTLHCRVSTRAQSYSRVNAFSVVLYHTRMVHTYHMRMVLPYAYGTILYTIRVRYDHTRITMPYVQIACHACLNAYSYSFFIYGSILLACSMPIFIQPI